MTGVFLNMVQFSIEFMFLKHYFAHGLQKHETKKSSSWWYFVCCNPIKLGLLYSDPPSQCAEDIINPAKGPKHKQAVEGFFFSMSALSPIHLFSWMDAAQTHLAPCYIYICIRGPNMCMGSFKMCLVTTGQILDGQMGSHGKKKLALSFLPLLFSFIVN
jgi:hypothetical protein